MSKVPYCPMIICLVTISICVFGCLKSVFGYAYDTAQKNNCGACHSLRKSKAKPGTWAGIEDVTCDVCHTDKRDDFSNVGAGPNYPSAHPVPVKGRSRGELISAGKKVMYCTNCHDAAQVDRGVHSTYVSAFRLRFSGLDGYGRQHYDPDPVDDAVSIGSSSSSWFWENPFDIGSKGFLRFGKIDHSPGNFDPKNARAGRETRDFYNTSSTMSSQFQLWTIYFCVTCHDSNGFPCDPVDTASEKICPGDIAKDYNDSDGNDSTLASFDGGHTIQAVGGTRTGLNLGGKLPCVDCHDSHSSNSNRKLIKDSFKGSTGWDTGTLGMKRAFCKIRCHNNTSNNTYYTNGMFIKYGGATSEILPSKDSGGLPTDDYHGNTNKANSKPCYGFGGCHGDPHKPVMACSGCHAKRYKHGNHPVNVELPSAILPGDSLSISEYYWKYADTMEVQLFDDHIDCYTCHNEHSGSTAVGEYAPEMQGLLRGDAGTNIKANLDSVTLGIGNNYPKHNSTQNERLWSLINATNTMTRGEFDSLRAMPELCLNCHFRVAGVKNDHGGFSGGSFGNCDKCHSMHGQHPEPADGALVNSTNIARSLHYGMYLYFEKINDYGDDEFNSAKANSKAYQTTVVKWTSRDSSFVHTTLVYEDAVGNWFSYRQNDNLIHDELQGKLCEKCHGNSNWQKIVNTTATQPAPPQVFYKAGKADTYYTTNVFVPKNRSKSTHPIDYIYQKMKGNFYENELISSKCSSGTSGPGCHSAHGNDNFAQLNVTIKIGINPSKSKYGFANVPYTGVGTQANYVSGMHTSCSLCHDIFGGNIYSVTAYDLSKGHYDYTRHPVGDSVSLLNLFSSKADRSQMDSAFFSTLVLDYDTNVYPSRPTYAQFKNAETTEAAKNFIVTCVTCHYQHGSPDSHLRKFDDSGVIECVKCHSKSPDILK